MTAARHIRERAPDPGVVMIERNPVFWSCSMSNKWLIDVLDTNFLVHSYMNPARRHGYTLVQAEVTGIDRGTKQVHTARGYVDYDRLGRRTPPLLYNFKADPQALVAGDALGAVSQHFGHYRKSGHVANRQAKAVATHIAREARGNEPEPVIIDNLCHMPVNNSPRAAIAVQFDYKIGPDGPLYQTPIDDNERRAELWESDLRWAGFIYHDFTAR